MTNIFLQFKFGSCTLAESGEKVWLVKFGWFFFLFIAVQIISERRIVFWEK